MPLLTTDDGAQLYATTTGTGPLTVIFLHCLGGDTETWTSLWRELDQTKIRCVGLDFRGTGKSQREPCELTNERLARDVLQVADHFGAASFVVVGHSMGAKLGLYLTTVAPQRIRGLILLGCPSPGLIPVERQVIDDYLAAPDRPAYTRAFFAPWFSVGPRPEIDAYLDSFARMPNWALLASCEASMWTDFSADLAPIDSPALLVVGEHDPVYGPSYQREQVRPHVPQADVVTIDCGHGLIIERPSEIARVLGQFLERVE